MEKKVLGARACLLYFVLVTALASWSAESAEALTPGECKQERKILVNACKLVITGRAPSAFCCERLRVTHVECVCPVITPKFAALIDVNYAIKVIQGCGRPVPRHFQCGSITTP